MGMLIDGTWVADADRSMKAGAYRREPSPLESRIDIGGLRDVPSEYVLVASYSCPWSHAAVLAAAFSGAIGTVVLQSAGGPRIEGYALDPEGPLASEGGVRHVHQLYTSTVQDYTGRATVPVLWHAPSRRIVSNSSAEIMRAFDAAFCGGLYPRGMEEEIDALIAEIFDGLSNAVYRAGKAQRQDEYEEAVDSVFSTMGRLESRLSGRAFLFGDAITAADLRLFATLVRFDSVYATHFRCTRRRLVDHPALWRYAREILAMPGVRETVDFNEIRRGYYLNDGSHNPFGIVAEQPEIDWTPDA